MARALGLPGSGLECGFGSAPFAGERCGLGPDGRLGRIDNHSALYAAFADDSSAEAKRREAAVLFCTAESQLDQEDVAEALSAAMLALPIFREVGDARAVHDTLRIIIGAQRLEANMDHEDTPAEAERFARQELATFEASDDKRGQASMLLCLAECLCDHRGVRPSQLFEAEGWAQQALDLFRGVQDDKMAAISLLELAHIHALRGEADAVLDKASHAREGFRKVGDKLGEARALHGVAIADAMDRRLPEAVSKMKDALATFRSLAVKKLEAFELCVIAEVHLEDEKPLKALPAAKEAFSIFREIKYGKGWDVASLLAVVRSFYGKQQPDLAVKTAQEGVAQILEQGDRRQEVYALQVLADALLVDGRASEALDTCRRAQEVALELDDKRLEIGVMHEMMWVHATVGDLGQAVDRMDDVANFAADLGDETEEALATHNLGLLYLQLGEHKQAMQNAKQAGALYEKVENQKGEAGALLVTALVLSEQDKLSDAIVQCTSAQDAYRSARDVRGEYEACTMLAELHLAQENLDAALKAAEHAAELMKRYRNKRLESIALRLVARVQLDMATPDLAEKSALRAKDAAASVQDRAEMTQAQLQLTQVYMVMSEGKEVFAKGPHPLERAMRSATEAVALSGRCNDRGLIAIARFVRAQLLNGVSRHDDAQRTAEEALRWFRKAEDQLGEARTLVLQGEIALGMNERQLARSLAAEAKALAATLGSAQAEAEASQLLERIEAKERAPVAQVAVVQNASVADAPAPVADATAVASAAKPEAKGLDLAMVKRKVTELTKNLMAGDDELENDSPFMEAGLDSLSSVQLMAELGKEFQMAMSPSLVFDFPTINALSDHLVEESKGGAY